MSTETQKIQSLTGLCKTYQKELKNQREKIRKLKTQNKELRNKASHYKHKLDKTEGIEVKITSKTLVELGDEINLSRNRLILEQNKLLKLQMDIEIKKHEIYLKTNFNELKLKNETGRKIYIENECKDLFKEKVMVQQNINTIKDRVESCKTLLGVYKLIYNRETEFKGLKLKI